ncbi:MAG: ABC transporter ATP-binding protein [Rhodospirillum sp.]|nr:ABC transporter ATP-binding protein [Rhodospirillum sp.]MCF8489710.1 ABC transporter ATP-binding protein [Rhodospirillum sp.]MCF8502573.1 ABC transporter ATP-binding protein [Rhodospirillum sp.]
MLEVEDLSVHYGQTAALRSLSLGAAQGEVTCVLGANGAGKSTLFRAIMGLAPKTHGVVRFAGEDITSRSTQEIVSMGIILCPEGRRLFPEMTVGENVRMGAIRVSDTRWIRQRLDFVHALFPRVLERREQQASSLSGGEQQMVAIARALMSDPTVLLLDEPTLGLAPMMIREVGVIVGDIRREGITVILVEQNARLALKVSDRGHVLETGELVLSGDSADILDDQRIQEVYLGG